MNPAENNGADFGGDDMVAAEYVVGTLPADQRQAASERIEHDAAFAHLVDAWEVRLSSLNTGYTEVAAPSSVKNAIDRRLFALTASAAQKTADRTGLFASLTFWRGLAAAALAALAISVSTGTWRLADWDTPQAKLVASLAADGSDVRYVALYDPAHHSLSFTRLSGESGADRDFELWMIDGQNAPVSMGVIPVGANGTVTVSDAVRENLTAGATLAISLEPTGGSPTGQPTGPVVAAGALVTI
jgi:anti-sigma-K factor RskA